MRLSLIAPIAACAALAAAPALAVVPGPEHGTAGPVALRLAPTTTVLTVQAPESAYVGSAASIDASLETDGGAPVPDVPVALEHWVAGQWVSEQSATTDATGGAAFSVTVEATAEANRYRVDFVGDDTWAPARSADLTIAPVKRRTTLRVSGPRSVTDETSVTLRFRWRAANGAPVAGTAVVHRRAAAGGWTRFSSLRFDAQGRAELVVRPREDTRWRARGAAGPWYAGATSAILALDNVPPVEPVRLPPRAPLPTLRLPRQPRAVAPGAAAEVSRISSQRWAGMVGRSWHHGCPVGRSGLRLVSVNYWGYDGYRYRGQLVVSAGVAGKFVNAFTALYQAEIPMRGIHPVDRFGWSSRLHGADDYRSMRAGNTSAFNCRGVVGRPSVRSPHAYGRSVDVNTWENPYRSAQGLVPNSWWQAHSHPRVAWRNRQHQVVRIMMRAGFRWTYGLGDTQHFDAPLPAGPATRWDVVPRGGSPETAEGSVPLD